MALFLSNVQNYEDEFGPFDPVLESAQGVVSVTLGGVTYLYVASWRDSRIAIFTLNEATGRATLLSTVENGADPDTNLAGVHDMTVVRAHGSTWLIAGGGNAGGSGLSVFEVQADGTLVNTDNIDDSGAGTLVNAYGRGATLTIGGQTYFYYPSRDGDALSVFRLDADGTLAAIQTVNDTANRELDGLRMVLAVEHGGRDFVLGIGFDDDGLSVFEAGTDGRLTTVQNIDDSADTLLREGTALAAAQFGNTTWIYAGGQLEDGITVFSMNANGTLSLHGTRPDTAKLALGGLFELTVAEIGGAQYLLASGFRDDGFSLFRAEADGSLTHLRSRFDIGNEQLETHDGAEIVMLDGVPYIYAMGDDDAGFSVYRINFPVAVTRNGAGLEVSETFAGAMSVARAGSTITLENDGLYEAGETGLAVTHRNITLDLAGLDTGPDGFDISLGGQTVSFTHAGTGAVQVSGTGAWEDITTGAGDDTILGRSGNDTVRSGAGDDRVYAASGQDRVNGGTGADTVRGGDGADVISGGGWADVLWGDAGGDTLKGGGGDDTIQGGSGNDVGSGGSGNDVIGGAGGRDTLAGGAGNDRLTGGSLGDVLTGDRGSDTLEGDQGNDLLLGGGWADRLTGGTGNDTATGGGGADTFVFRAGDDTLRITDFRDDTDVLDLDLAAYGFAGDPEGLIASSLVRNTASGHTVFDLSADERIVVEGIADKTLLADDIL